MRKIKILLYALFTALLIFSVYYIRNSRSQDLEELSGYFSGEFFNVQKSEMWEELEDDKIKASGFRESESAKVLTENIGLIQIGDDIYYFAKPVNADKHTFFLSDSDISSEKGEFLFENPEHDFPQMIKYVFRSDSVFISIGEDELEKAEVYLRK